VEKVTDTDRDRTGEHTEDHQPEEQHQQTG
jgi:hypothetical protein